MNTLWIAFFMVIVLWVIILGLYLNTTRRQPDLRAQMQALDERLAGLEKDSGKG